MPVTPSVPCPSHEVAWGGGRVAGLLLGGGHCGCSVEEEDMLLPLSCRVVVWGCFLCCRVAVIVALLVVGCIVAVSMSLLLYFWVVVVVVVVSLLLCCFLCGCIVTVAVLFSLQLCGCHCWVVAARTLLSGGPTSCSEPPHHGSGKGCRWKSKFWGTLSHAILRIFVKKRNTHKMTKFGMKVNIHLE